MPLLLLLPPALPAWAGPVDWQPVPTTDEGQQWWDAGSLRLNRAGNLMVLSRFLPAADGEARAVAELYVMEIDCPAQSYRDISVNGLPRFRPAWRAGGDEGLTRAVIGAACSAAAQLQAG